MLPGWSGGMKKIWSHFFIDPFEFINPSPPKKKGEKNQDWISLYTPGGGSADLYGRNVLCFAEWMMTILSKYVCM